MAVEIEKQFGDVLMTQKKMIEIELDVWMSKR